MNKNIQREVAATRARQIEAGVPSTQLARNLMPMRQLVPLAILSAQSLATVKGELFHGLTLQGILKWLAENDCSANYGTVAATLNKLHRAKIIKGGYDRNVATSYLWTVN